MSVYFALLTAVADAIAASDIPSDVPVLIRRRGALVDGDPTPCIVVSPDREASDEEALENSLTVAYPVVVTTFIASNRQLAEDAGLTLSLRETARRAIHRTDFPDFTGGHISNVTLDLDPIFDPAALDANCDASRFVVTYSVEEPRTNE
jgi:hypothetical protein